MRTLFLLSAFLWAALMFTVGVGCAYAAPAGISQADIDRMIQKTCLDQGGKPEECSCGLKIAREGLTERQFGMFPILWPIVNGKGDYLAKLAAGVAALEAKGYNINDGLALMATLQANAGRVEQECRRKP